MSEDKLQEILTLHKKWLRNENAGIKADLRCANLRCADLRDADLRGADLRDADLRGADLRDADLQGANLRCANLRCADLRDADLRCANLRCADLRDADLRCANLRDANLDHSCWPLWCGSVGVKVDKRIAAQMAYHFCTLDCEDEEVKERQKELYSLANKFHRVQSGDVKALGMEEEK